MRTTAAASALFTLLWAAAVAAGFTALLDFDSRPGEAGVPPAVWPGGSALARNDGLPTLIMVLHPHCPCSRASLAELERIAARSRGRLQTVVLLYAPGEARTGWTDTESRRRAASIPGATLVVDTDGVEQRRFGLRTSGHTLYYDAEGILQFSGGVTASRGHEGDSAGSLAILSLMNQEPAVSSLAPVFGCPLHEPVACSRK